MPLYRHSQEHTGPQMESALRPVRLLHRTHNLALIDLLFYFYLNVTVYLKDVKDVYHPCYIQIFPSSSVIFQKRVLVKKKTTIIL